MESGAAPAIRLASNDDLDAIRDIYNHYVATSTATFQLEPESSAERRRWFDAHDERHPVTVAEHEGRIAGWASLSRFNAREGYRMTVESSVYVHHEHHRRGIGKLLTSDIVRRARELGHHTIIAGVADDQEASIALHLGFGFTEVARLREVGHKFDRWLDVVYLQLLLR